MPSQLNLMAGMVLGSTIEQGAELSGCPGLSYIVCLPGVHEVKVQVWATG